MLLAARMRRPPNKEASEKQYHPRDIQDKRGRRSYDCIKGIPIVGSNGGKVDLMDLIEIGWLVASDRDLVVPLDES